MKYIAYSLLIPGPGCFLKSFFLLIRHFTFPTSGLLHMRCKTPLTTPVICLFQHTFCPTMSSHIWISRSERFHISIQFFQLFWLYFDQSQLGCKCNFRPLLKVCDSEKTKGDFFCFSQRLYIITHYYFQVLGPEQPRFQIHPKIWLNSRPGLFTTANEKIQVHRWDSFSWPPLTWKNKIWKKNHISLSWSVCEWVLWCHYLQWSQPILNKFMPQQEQPLSRSHSLPFLIDHMLKLLLMNYWLPSLVLSSKLLSYYLKMFSNYLTV